MQRPYAGMQDALRLLINFMHGVAGVSLLMKVYNYLVRYSPYEMSSCHIFSFFHTACVALIGGSGFVLPTSKLMTWQ